MITLLLDGLIAVVKLVDRGVSVVEKNVRRRLPPAAAQPAAGHPPAGHSRDVDTSELLTTSARYIHAFRNTVTHTANGPFLVALDEHVTILRDRAAQFAAIGD